MPLLWLLHLQAPEGRGQHLSRAVNYDLLWQRSLQRIHYQSTFCRDIRWRQLQTQSFCKQTRPNLGWYWYEEVWMKPNLPNSGVDRRGETLQNSFHFKILLDLPVDHTLANAFRSSLAFHFPNTMQFTPCSKQKHRPQLFSVACCWRLCFFLERLGTHLGRPVGQNRNC